MKILLYYGSVLLLAMDSPLLVIPGLGMTGTVSKRPAKVLSESN